MTTLELINLNIKEGKITKNKSITCPESKEVWSSIKECSESIGLAQSNVCRYLANGKTYKGIHLEYVK